MLSVVLYTHFIIFFGAQGTQFPRAVNIKREMKRVWKGHGADSEIGNVSAKQAALNRWTATDKRWKRKAVSLEGQSSPQTNAFRFVPGTPELCLALTALRVSRATGKKLWVWQSELYLFIIYYLMNLIVCKYPVFVIVCCFYADSV